jgi:hypothetical protein
MSGWNLPPGTTSAHIEAQAGDDICNAYSPDGQYQCDNGVDHNGAHMTHGSLALWETLDGELVPMEGVLVVAQWPQRDSDFNEYGEPVRPEVA